MIHSASVTDALLGEIGGLAAKLAPWMVRLSLESPPDSAMPAVTGLTFHDSGRWLWAAALGIETRSHQEPAAGEGRRVLAAIPANLPPAYCPLAAETTVPELCEGVITTAALCSSGPPRSPHRPLVRASHLCLLAARRPGLSDHRGQQRVIIRSLGRLPPGSGFIPPSRPTSRTAPAP